MFLRCVIKIAYLMVKDKLVGLTVTMKIGDNIEKVSRKESLNFFYAEQN